MKKKLIDYYPELHEIAEAADGGEQVYADLEELLDELRELLDRNDMEEEQAKVPKSTPVRSGIGKALFNKAASRNLAQANKQVRPKRAPRET